MNIDLTDYDVDQVGTQTTERWAAAKQELDKTPPMQGGEAFVVSARERERWIEKLDEIAAGVANSIQQVEALQAEVKMLRERAARLEGERDAWKLEAETKAEWFRDAVSNGEKLVATERARGETLREALDEAPPILERFALDNPKWSTARHPDLVQDPYGVHALLEKLKQP